MTLINNRNLFNTKINGPLEYIGDFDLQKNPCMIDEKHLNSHRGLNSLPRELSKKYYNTKQSEIKLF